MIVLGCDPGATTALVWINAPRYPDHFGATWIDSAVIHRPGPTKAAASSVERDLRFAAALEAAVLDHPMPGVVVAEEPVDFGVTWDGGQGQEGEQTRGTSMRLGVAYGLLLAAFTVLDLRRISVYSYPTTNYGKRRGWMQISGGKVEKREITLAKIRLYAKAMNAPGELTAHECMALGVAYAHLSATQNERLLARLPGVK